jgi:hypothetical protein
MRRTYSFENRVHSLNKILLLVLPIYWKNKTVEKMEPLRKLRKIKFYYLS